MLPAEGGGEEPLGQRLPVVVGPLGTRVAAAVLGQGADHPLHERARRRPRVGLERREGDRADLDGLGDAGAGVGEVELAEHDVGILAGHRPERRHGGLDRLVDDEPVLGDRPEVVVDVDRDGQRPTGRGARGQEDVVAVAQHVTHLHGLLDGQRRQARKPVRQPVLTSAQLALDAAARQRVVDHRGDARQQRRGLGQADLDEGRGQLRERRPFAVLPARASHRVGAARVDHGQHRAREVEQLLGMVAAQDAADVDDERLLGGERASGAREASRCAGTSWVVVARGPVTGSMRSGRGTLLPAALPLRHGVPRFDAREGRG